MLVLGAVTTTSLTSLWITGADLLHDWNDGIAEWPEYLAVAFAGVLSAGWTVVWVALAVHPWHEGTREGAAMKPPVVWDRELDRLPNPKGRPR
jgi:hypothetical protein